LAQASAAAALIYAAARGAQPPPLVLALVKAAPVAALAALAYITGSQTQLVLAFGFSALGDGISAAENPEAAPAQLAAFLLAAVAFVSLFVEDGGGRLALQAEPWRNLGVAAGMAAPAFALARLWPRIATPALAAGACAYAVALAILVGAAFTLPHRLWPAIAGAGGLMAADGLKAARQFGGWRADWGALLGWGLYYAAQALIAWGYLR
jgi:uncharacterized membrane protein YhhN